MFVFMLPTMQIPAFFTHQTSCGSTSVAPWKWWTWHQGASWVCRTGPSCHTLADQWYKNTEGSACDKSFHCGGSSFLETCFSVAGTLCESASSSVRTSLSCMGLKRHSQSIPHTSRGSWCQAGICAGWRKTSKRQENSCTKWVDK